MITSVEDLGGPALTLKEGVEVFAMHVIFCRFSMHFQILSSRISYKNMNFQIRKNLMYELL